GRQGVAKTRMELGRLVDLVAEVRATSRKTEKVARIADFLRETQDRETELAALYLTGTLPQGRIGIGGRTLQSVRPEGPPTGPPPTLANVDEAMDAVASA